MNDRPWWKLSWPRRLIHGTYVPYAVRKSTGLDQTSPFWDECMWECLCKRTTTLTLEENGLDYLRTITEGDAEDFKLFLIGDGLAPTTIHKRLQVARMFFGDARKRKLVESNPFAEVSANATMDEGRKKFVTFAEYKKILDVCDPKWRSIVALCRIGGLRCPSEVLSLRWVDVNWQSNRIVVTSPKTAHHPGKGSRTIPLFTELREVLDEAYEIAAEGAEYVVGGGYLKTAQSPNGWRNCNLRTQFERIVKRAGLTIWPRPFHSMRASRETELAADHPIHVVTAWLGNTPKIALKHYLSVRDEDFDRAIQCSTKNSAQTAQNAAQHEHAENGTHSQETKQAPVKPELVRDVATTGEVVPVAKVEVKGFEPSTLALRTPRSPN